MTGTETPAAPTRQSAGVRVAPGAYFLAGLAMGFAVDLFVSLPFPMPVWVSAAAGAALLAAGVAFAAAAMIALRRAGTPIDPMKSTTALLTSGVYGMTRNPAYLGLTLASAGIALAGRSLPSLLLLPCVVAVVQHRVIRREEKYLSRVFGPAYDAYSARVRRWI